MDSSPGFPWMCAAGTNEQLIALLGQDAIVDLVVSRLEALLAGFARYEQGGSWTASELVENDMCDPVRLFVKNELHGRDKVRDRRFRLIASVSLIDQLVERILFSRQNKAEIDAWQVIPSKPGMGLHDEGLDALKEGIGKLQRPVDTDVSGFDWSVKDWALNLDAVARLRLMGFNTPIKLSQTYRYSAVERLVLARVRCLSLSVLVTSDGGVYAQQQPGIQKSGSYNTSSTNSRVRWMMARLAGAEEAICMGDDAVEEYHPGAPEAYKAMGLLVKEYEERSLEVGLSFCSHRFTADGPAEPENWSKLTARLLNTVPATQDHMLELWTSYLHNMRHSRHLCRAVSLIVLSGWGPAQNSASTTGC